MKRCTIIGQLWCVSIDIYAEKSGVQNPNQHISVELFRKENIGCYVRRKYCECGAKYCFVMTLKNPHTEKNYSVFNAGRFALEGAVDPSEENTEWMRKLNKREYVNKHTT
jgi:hypothetical protein